MAVIGINYNEGGDPINYKSVYVRLSEGKKKNYTFKSGNFVKDWYNAIKKVITNETEPLVESSSVHHFITDGAKFDSTYLHMVNNNPVLKYIDRSTENWYLTTIDEGIEFFVDEGTTPTWKELQVICGDVK